LYQSLLADTSFFSLLLRIDRDLAQQARAGGCPWCGGSLHRASYRRKPRVVRRPGVLDRVPADEVGQDDDRVSGIEGRFVLQVG